MIQQRNQKTKVQETLAREFCANLESVEPGCTGLPLTAPQVPQAQLQILQRKLVFGLNQVNIIEAGFARYCVILARHCIPSDIDAHGESRTEKADDPSQEPARNNFDH